MAELIVKTVRASNPPTGNVPTLTQGTIGGYSLRTSSRMSKMSQMNRFSGGTYIPADTAIDWAQLDRHSFVGRPDLGSRQFSRPKPSDTTLEDLDDVDEEIDEESELRSMESISQESSTSWRSARSSLSEASEWTTPAQASARTSSEHIAN